MRKILTITTLAVLALTFSVLAEEQAGQATKAADDPRLEFLKGLAGTWAGEATEGEMPPGVFEFRVTAGGSAVEEREMVGTPMEMLTVYHMDGNELVATHYCMLGNQPHVTAAKRVVDNTLAFSCNGKPGNTSSHDDKHIHGWTIKLDGEDTLVYSGELVEEGKLTEAPRFVLTRQQDTASR
jgi:hypothetical protein